jgi:hypothetical protein
VFVFLFSALASSVPTLPSRAGRSGIVIAMPAGCVLAHNDAAIRVDKKRAVDLDAVVIESFNNATASDLKVLLDLPHVFKHEIAVAVAVLVVQVMHIQQLDMDHPIVLVDIHDGIRSDAVDLVADVSEGEAFVVHTDLVAPDPGSVNSRSLFFFSCTDHANLPEPVRRPWHALCKGPVCDLDHHQGGKSGKVRKIRMFSMLRRLTAIR